LIRLVEVTLGESSSIQMLSSFRTLERIATTDFHLKATKPAVEFKLKSVYLFSYLAPERRNGPNLKYEVTADFRLIFTVKKDEIARFSGVTILGDYQFA